VLTNAAGVAGGVLAAAGLAVSHLTGGPVPDTVAGALIGLVLLATSIVLLHTNRELLTGRGLPLAEITRMREVVRRQGWPATAYVYLNPVAAPRARRHHGAAPPK
jgi:divalent metal cation (Fe/Co/Zn/Cd) transporter